MTRPEPTTRPLYWLAQEQGKDYSDVLQVADGIKRLLTHRSPTIWYQPALNRIVMGEDTAAKDSTYTLIFHHVSGFVAEQDTIRREAQKAAWTKRNEPDFPDEPHSKDL